MNILVLNIEYPPLGGGASPACERISSAYAANGHTVHVVTMHHGDLAEKEEVNGVYVFRVKCGRKASHMSHVTEHISFLWNARKLLVRLCATTKYDVCHCHFLIPTGLLAYWLKYYFKIPYITTVHGSDVPGYNPDRFQIMHRLTRPLIRIIVKQSSYIVSPSAYLANLLKPQLSPDMIGKVLTIPYSIDTPATNAQLDKSNIILSTGRLLPRKGFDTLIRAVKTQDLGYEVHIFGDGPEKDALTSLAIDSKTPIIFHGWVDARSEVYQSYLRRAKIFCLMSSHENASVSIMEAMTHGCAIISTNQTGCVEMVSDIGICLAVGDHGALSSHLSFLVNDDLQIADMGQKAMQKAAAVYNPSTVYEAYHDLLNKTVDRG